MLFDNKSIDNSPRIAQDYAATHPNVIYKRFSKHTANVPKRRNLAAKLSKDDIILFIDADMVLAPDCVEQLVTPIREGRAEATAHNKELVYNGTAWIARTFFHQVRVDLPVGSTSPVARAIRRTTFLRNGGFEGFVGVGDDTSPKPALVVKTTIYHNNPSTWRELLPWVRRLVFSNPGYVFKAILGRVFKRKA